MEAARHLDDQEAPASVRALGDRVEIERLVVGDPRCAELVRSRQERGQAPEETIRTTIEVGARVLEREAVAGEVDYVRGEFERTAGQVRELFTESARQIDERLRTELERAFDQDEGVLARALEGNADAIAEEISRNFGEDSAGAVQHQIREHVGKLLEDSRRELIRHLSTEDGQNPLADFKRAIVHQVDQANRAQADHATRLDERLGELREQLVRLSEQSEARKRLAEVEEKGSAKGRAFEDEVFTAIEAIAGSRGDEAGHVGDEAAVGGGKRGDVVVELDASDGPCTGRIVLEVKDERLSKNEAWRVLDASLAQREADFAVLVVAGEDRVPAGRQQLHEYEGDKMIVAVDREEPASIALEAAYRLARSRVRMKRDRSLEVDAVGVRDAAEAAASALRSTQSIKRGLTEAGKSMESARETLEEMESRIRSELARIETLVQTGE